MKSSFCPTFCLQVAISRALASFWRYHEISVTIPVSTFTIDFVFENCFFSAMTPPFRKQVWGYVGISLSVSLFFRLSACLSFCPCLVGACPPKPLNGFWDGQTDSYIPPNLFAKGGGTYKYLDTIT
jgi:hypothetical protein